MSNHTTEQSSIKIPYSYCQCGCGRVTPVSQTTDLKRGIVKGKHTRFCKGHRLTSTPDQLFWKNVTPSNPDDCWEWQGHINDSGYGDMRCGSGPLLRAHRVSYEIHKGTIPDALFVCHSCDNPRCVNPNHLWLGTDADSELPKAKALGLPSQ